MQLYKNTAKKIPPQKTNASSFTSRPRSKVHT